MKLTKEEIEYRRRRVMEVEPNQILWLNDMISKGWSYNCFANYGSTVHSVVMNMFHNKVVTTPLDPPFDSWVDTIQFRGEGGSFTEALSECYKEFLVFSENNQKS